MQNVGRICQNNAIRSPEIQCNFSSGSGWSIKPTSYRLSLTVEPAKPRLYHDARYLNLWMLEKSFSLDRVTNVSQYVLKDSYQTVLDDKSGYNHLLLSEESSTYFDISSWAVGCLPIIHYRLVGKFHLMYIIRRA